jgi:kynurenine formamidase
MAEVITTMKISVTLKKAETTGLIDEEAHEALKAKELLVQEKVENLKKLHTEGSISLDQMMAGIKTIQQEIQDRTTALDDDAEILS